MRSEDLISTGNHIIFACEFCRCNNPDESFINARVLQSSWSVNRVFLAVAIVVTGLENCWNSWILSWVAWNIIGVVRIKSTQTHCLLNGQLGSTDEIWIVYQLVCDATICWRNYLRRLCAPIWFHCESGLHNDEGCVVSQSILDRFGLGQGNRRVSARVLESDSHCECFSQISVAGIC